jgi:hypothetical protein
MTNTETQTNEVRFYEGSTLFNSKKTDLNIGEDYIGYKLAQQYEYRPTTESLWATVRENGKEVARFELIYGKGLNKIK